ncbi:hypothetical protein QWZ16_21535 [Vibrio ostreicida]|uniref:DUF3265 domain-containing protein n=1 Tax=Vibrio ostreicida TaxID=526588 RepID=A0ABT8BYF0_9VIBR|nr:hypothetical protein [Vibrio ostreicida]MDN3612180.1 hypothetical protein [Vibrio ostreicida]
MIINSSHFIHRSGVVGNADLNGCRYFWSLMFETMIKVVFFLAVKRAFNVSG